MRVRVGNNSGRRGAAIRVGGLSKTRALSDDNRVVHGLWIGRHLSKLELLTIHSFLQHGHEFHLWLYDDLDAPLPKGVVVEDAEAILPRSRIVHKRTNDRETGVGRGSLAPFADLFRYKLLYEKGGYWVDMDVTCLRPFDFRSAYLFRPHRVGVVNNIMKCPPGSALMKLTYERVARAFGDDIPWLLPNRILSQNILDLKLRRYVRPGICNDDDWRGAIKPLVEGDVALPKDWFAVHWVNEMWRTLAADGGRYKGRRYVDHVPDKDAVPAGTTLGRLYRQYGLTSDVPPTDRSEPSAAPIEVKVSAPILVPIARQPTAPNFADELHINIMISSLTLGGAERSVVETLQGLEQRRPTANLFVLNEAEPAYGLGNIGRTRVHRLERLDAVAKMRTVALEVMASPTPVVFTHLIKAHQLRMLWAWGVTTIPVIHNSRAGWHSPPASFDSPHVPFVAAVSDSVAQQLRQDLCPRPVITLRHETQRWFSLDALIAHRSEIRARHAISANTLLIGMVGEFKSQKAYTRAVRVLAEIRRHHPAKLMILGGWDHAWGNGRAAYTAACRQAVELGVMADLLTPGAVRDVERYYAAFDVFLNTSIYEGLSLAALEATRAGCPIVSADAGGNREGLPPDAVIVEDSADIAAYVCGIEKVLARARRPVPTRPADADLVPRLVCLLGQHRAGHARQHEAGGGATLFLSDNLNLGGAARSLVNLLARLPPERRPWLGLLNEVNHQAYFDELEAAGVPVFSLRTGATYLDRVERILQMVRRLEARTIVFWNLDARVKLLLAKILPREAARLIDVSPGPWLFEDLGNAAPFQQRVAFDRIDYFDRIDAFVAKYADGAPFDPPLKPGKLKVIPNGVPDLASVPPRAPPSDFPRGLDPKLVIGTSCRILPSRRLEFLVDVMAELNRRLPGAALVVIGAGNSRYIPYFASLQDRARAHGVFNIHYVGQQADVASFLRRFRVFVMMTEGHGCPNSSLEAMSLGLPIVANSDGGVAEQVEHGVNGFLVSEDPKDMAHRVRTLLTNPAMRKRFGAASRRIAREKFSMDRMVGNYVRLLGGAQEHSLIPAPRPVVRVHGGNGATLRGDLHA
jgi:glycosyltransferase involved in cell wall biosynthesis